MIYEYYDTSRPDKPGKWIQGEPVTGRLGHCRCIGTRDDDDAVHVRDDDIARPDAGTGAHHEPFWWLRPASSRLK